MREYIWFEEITDMTPALMEYLHSRQPFRDELCKVFLPPAKESGYTGPEPFSQWDLGEHQGFDFGSNPSRCVKSLIRKTPEGITIADLLDHPQESFRERYKGIVIPF